MTKKNKMWLGITLVGVVVIWYLFFRKEDELKIGESSDGVSIGGDIMSSYLSDLGDYGTPNDAPTSYEPIDDGLITDASNTSDIGSPCPPNVWATSPPPPDWVEIKDENGCIIDYQSPAEISSIGSSTGGCVNVTCIDTASGMPFSPLTYPSCNCPRGSYNPNKSRARIFNLRG